MLPHLIFQGPLQTDLRKGARRLTSTPTAMTTEPEKDIRVQHAEERRVDGLPAHDEDVDADAEVTGFEADQTQLPEGYFRSRFFVGSFLAIGFSLWAGTGAL